MEDAILVGAARTGAILVLEELNEALLVYRQSLKNQRAREDDRFTFGRQSSEDIFENANNEVIFEHLHLESERLEEMVRETMRSLEIDGNLDFLINNIAKQRAARIEEDAILGDAREKQAALAQLRQDIAGEQERRKNEEERLKTELLRLRNEKEGLRLKSDMELEYVEAWLSSRREQDDLRMMESCDLLEAKLSDCRKRETGELLVSKNIKAFLKLTTEKYVKDSYVWMERQQTETKSYNEEIRRLQEEIGKKRATLEELYKEYTSKQEFIDGCLAEKEATRKKLEHEDHVRRQTIRIQAWWRGVMVRRKLGPYRPEDKKRKRPNKSKK